MPTANTWQENPKKDQDYRKNPSVHTANGWKVHNHTLATSPKWLLPLRQISATKQWQYEKYHLYSFHHSVPTYLTSTYFIAMHYLPLCKVSSTAPVARARLLNISLFYFTQDNQRIIFFVISFQYLRHFGILIFF